MAPGRKECFFSVDFGKVVCSKKNKKWVITWFWHFESGSPSLNDLWIMHMNLKIDEVTCLSNIGLGPQLLDLETTIISSMSVR